MFTDNPSRPLRVLLLMSLVAAAALVRQLPHPENFTPLGALAIFAGACFADRRLALAVPLAALLPGDLAVGLHVFVPVVYGSLALNVLLARWLRGRRTAGSIAAVTLLGAVQFFVTTNFAVWVAFYPHTLDGLVACYVAAVPYFRNTLLGDATFVALLFGALALAERAVPAVREPAPLATN